MNMSGKLRTAPRILSILTALALLLSGCSSTSTNNSSNNNQSTNPGGSQQLAPISLITCLPIVPAISTWPNGIYSQACWGNGSPQPSGTMEMVNTLQGLSSTVPDAASRLASAGARFYIFNTAQDYHSSSGSDPTPCEHPEVHNAWGETRYLIVNGSYIRCGWSAIFNQSWERQVDTVVTNTTAHEAGHQLDAIYSQILSSTTGFTSDSQLFQDALRTDLNALAQWSPCFYQYASGPAKGIWQSGLFSGIKDAQGNYYCSAGYMVPESSQLAFTSNALDGVIEMGNGTQLGGVYAGLTNQEVVDKICTCLSGQDISHEFFAEIFATISGNPTQGEKPQSVYLTQPFGGPDTFVCSTAIIGSLATEGRVDLQWSQFSPPLGGDIYLNPDTRPNLGGTGYSTDACPTN